ncbi:MAG: OmpH family outer membrane protein [Planctomycetota bacterium]|nr:OmpH family outer membrane protein [Planctomycetota bacterium]MEC8735142.1 OmpH family outer membrane protein [Planctomycetota bacterium]MEC8818839.1 OmpH family outer membrane protein [Planctomycetota bacterium]MED5507098.1 OmpH family outer membrane protein [Planctomycetota bacterium]MED6307184.1 OmpH family outer membrane protein [Planctomycetota bacterium]
MTRLSNLNLIALLTLATGFVFMAGYAASSQLKPAVVGVVDLERVFNNLDSRKVSEQKILAMRDKMVEEAQVMKDELEMISAELESLEAGSATMVEMNDQAISISGKLRAFETYGQLLIEREQATALRKTYETIKEQAGQLATQMDIDLVLLNDSIPTVDLSDAAGTLQQISARRILWANQTLDITDQLLERMNGS